MSQFSRKDRFWGEIIYGIMWLFGQLPAWWHYFWSFLLSYVLQYLVGYRREVVRDQLALSLPEKSEEERCEIERGVYRHLCDIAVEYIMLAGFSRRAMLRHLESDNIRDLLGELHEKGHKNVFLVLGHYGNWEWLSGFQAMLPMTQLYVLYQRQHGIANFLLYKLRSKFGTQLLEKRESVRDILRLKDDQDPKTVIFVADQSPGLNSIHLFVDFMKRETAMYTGMESLARKLRCPVVYADIWRPKRGHYRLEGEMMTEDASQLPEWQLSADFMRRLEKTIMRQPELWLWSHRRWKHSYESVKRAYPHKELAKL
ncbi:MAG: lysophospholipid acyltransferase family protein [Porphyromonas sp.]|nr:lysophospholipid acyltransferase family protein [Porphyromonas sp.]